MFVITPSPARRLALQPAHRDERGGENRDAGDIGEESLLRREKERRSERQHDIDGEHQPALPCRRNAPTITVAFRWKPVFAIGWLAGRSLARVPSRERASLKAIEVNLTRLVDRL